MFTEIFNPKNINLDLESTTKDDAFAELIGSIVSNSEYDYYELLEAVNSRESKMSTKILPGVAVPHGYSSSIPGIIGAIGFSRLGIEYENTDTPPVHLLIMLLMGEKSRELHLRVLSRILSMLKSEDFPAIHKKVTPGEINDLLHRFNLTLKTDIGALR